MPERRGPRFATEYPRKRRRSPKLVDLLIAAGAGDYKECKRLIRHGLSVSTCDDEGRTALHEACLHGRLKTVKYLLKHGAETGVQDVKGDTPGHCAARPGHVAVLAALLDSRRPPDLGIRNRFGMSLAEAVETALGGGVGSSPRSGGAGRVSSESGSYVVQKRGPDDDWAARLAAEVSGDEEDPYLGGFWGDQDASAESVDALAERLWREMQERIRKQRTSAAAQAAQASEAERAEREAKAAAASERSRRILEEEQRKEAAWKEARAQGRAGAKRAMYDARWHRFVGQKGTIHVEDVPWILGSHNQPDQELLRRVILYGADSVEAQKRFLRTEVVRWHPDKFEARYGSRFDPGQASTIRAGVLSLSQTLNALATSLT